MSKDKEDLTGHDYDGIQEYDNPLPLWWLATFIGTVIFSFMYWIHYGLGAAPTQLTELKIELAEIQANPLHQRLHESSESENEYLRLIAKLDVVNGGKNLFIARCAACHGEKLQGIIGPNLVDQYWIHGQGKLTQISQTVRSGVPEKGMPAWGGVLKDDEIKSIVAFIGSQKGTKPVNPKAPQGEKVE